MSFMNAVSVKSQKTMKGLKKPTSIPRPLNSFMIYRLEKQKEIIKNCPGTNHREVSKIVSKWWKELSPKDRQPFIEKAEKLKYEHSKMYPEYKFKPTKRKSSIRPYNRKPIDKLSAQDVIKKERLMTVYSKELSYEDVFSAHVIEKENPSNTKKPKNKKSTSKSTMKEMFDPVYNYGMDYYSNPYSYSDCNSLVSEKGLNPGALYYDLNTPTSSLSIYSPYTHHESSISLDNMTDYNSLTGCHIVNSHAVSQSIPSPINEDSTMLHCIPSNINYSANYQNYIYDYYFH